MSVLMKALEKAARDRDKAPDNAQSAGSELTLEALEPKRGTGNTGAAAASAAGTSDSARSSAQMNAATVLSARQPRAPGNLTWFLAHPLYAFGGLAGVFLAAYAMYVYVQIFHPGWLIRTAPTQPMTQPVAQPAAVAPAPAAANANTAARDVEPSAATSPPDGGESRLTPLQSVYGGSATVQPTAASAESAKDASAGVLLPRAAPPAAPAPRSATATTAAPAVSAPPAASAVPLLPRDRVAVSRGDTAAPRVNPVVSEAYAALEAGQFDTAQRLYGQVLRSEPANIDALLGLAAIAQKENRSEDAQRHFLAILNVEPRNALAQAGLLALMSRADPLAAESRLKQLIAREPSAPLYFNLGNLYADQGQWPQAQQAYFQAHDLDPKNPDYAYNLAVGLEHLDQQKLALGYYRKALQLASARGAAHFDPARIQERITQLAARFE